MDWVAGICLVLAAVTLAGNQALKDAPALTARLQWLRPKGWWNYLPISFLALACLAYGSVWLMPSMTIGEQSGVVVTGIPTQRLTAIVDEHTAAEAQRLIEPYKGTKVRISGPISDVSSDEYGAYVQLRGSGMLSDITALSFGVEQSKPVLTKQIGDRIEALCIFEGNIDRLGISFRQCVLEQRAP